MLQNTWASEMFSCNTFFERILSVCSCFYGVCKKHY